MTVYEIGTFLYVQIRIELHFKKMFNLEHFFLSATFVLIVVGSILSSHQRFTAHVPASESAVIFNFV
jgi:hypothetical protein